MMKRYLIILMAVFFTSLNAGAVLKEKSLARTLGVLRLELFNKWQKQKMFMERYEQNETEQHATLIDFLQRSEQISLMLYSQRNDNTLDVAYSCQHATQLYRELSKTNVPYELILNQIRSEISRYDSLICALQLLPPVVGDAARNMSAVEARVHALADSLTTDSLRNDSLAETEDAPEPFVLTGSELEDREKCLVYATALKNNLMRMLVKIVRDQKYYVSVTEKVQVMNDYAHRKYSQLQDAIFVQGGKNYFAILGSLKQNIAMVVLDFTEKYMPIKKTDVRYSEWRGPGLLFNSVFMVFYILVGALLSNIILRWILPKRVRQNETFRQKRYALMVALSLFIFIIAVTIIRFVVDQNVVQMSTGLMINIAWLMEAVLISLIIRLNGNQLGHGVNMYIPFIVMAFIVIIFRIILIPNSLVNLVFPPVLLLCTLWQIYVGQRSRKYLPMGDRFYCSISLFVIAASTVISWVGYTLLAVQITIWWTFQLAAIQTITCLYDLLGAYCRNRVIVRVRQKEQIEEDDEKLMERIKKGNFIHLTFLFDFAMQALLPVASVLSVLLCVWFAADVFAMTATFRTLFFYSFIDQPTVIQLSLFKLCLVLSFFFIFRYINYAARSFYFHIKLKVSDDGDDFNRTLAKNIIAILAWGTYFVSSLMLLQVPQSGISVVTAGLATGLGFAMKDLLENFFYGISLMTGRVRVGDYIECDGVFGKVESITYQSTQVVALDGSVIAFLNSALFNKNFRNLTRNNQYELVKIPIGVAYGCDVNKVREMIVNALKPLGVTLDDGRDVVDMNKGWGVVFSDFGESSIDLIVTQWVLVDQRGPYTAKAKEIIYEVLTANAVEIPFPKRDVYIKTM